MSLHRPAFALTDRLIVVGKASTISAQLGTLAARMAINPNSGTMPECAGGASALSRTTAEGGFLPPALRSRGELAAEYVSMIGYDLFEDDPSISEAEVSRILAERRTEGQSC